MPPLPQGSSFSICDYFLLVCLWSHVYSQKPHNLNQLKNAIQQEIIIINVLCWSMWWNRGSRNAYNMMDTTTMKFYFIHDTHLKSYYLYKFNFSVNKFINLLSNTYLKNVWFSCVTFYIPVWTFSDGSIGFY